jgi:uncharacterized protein (DUF2252 family)
MDKTEILIVDGPANADQRALLGRAARKHLHRAELGALSLEPVNRNPVALIQQQEKNRIQELLPLRHHRMSQSAFAFYRGSALLMAHDLAEGRKNTGIHVQLCGDAHLANFGLFAAPNRDVLFDINDFDETHPGPFEWDVHRLATSYWLALHELGHGDMRGNEIVALLAESYRKAMAHYARIPEIDIWYEHPNEAWMERTLDTLTGKSGIKQFKAYIKRARERDRWTAVIKLTEAGPKGRQFTNNPPTLVRIPLDQVELDRQQELYEDYTTSLDLATQELLGRYRVIDVGHKVVGVGSVGLTAYVYLLQGYHSGDLIVLQVKEAVPSVMAQYLTDPSIRHDGKRVVRGQRIMQAASDLFLGWVRAPLGREFYVRQLRDMKYKPDPQELDLTEIKNLAWLSGITLARAHARSGQSIAIHSYLGHSNRFDKAIVAFAEHYTHQVITDFKAFQTAISNGTLPEARQDVLPPEFSSDPNHGVFVSERTPPTPRQKV